MSESAAGAIADTVTDLFGATSQTEDTADAVTAPEAEVATVSEAEQQFDFDAAVRALDEEPEDEPDFTVTDEDLATISDDELAATEFDDEQTLTLKRELAAARKKAEYHERRHLDTSRRSWEDDVRAQPWGAFLPEDLSVIKASSHRDFNRQARQMARTTYTLLKPHIAQLQAEKDRLKEAAMVEARAEAAAAWGKPTLGSGPRVPLSAEQGATNKRSEALEDARRRRSLVGVVKALVDDGQIQ